MEKNESIVLIQNLYKIRFLGFVLVGEVKSGVLKPNMKLNVNGKIMEVKSIEMNRLMINEAQSGDKIGFSLSNANDKILGKLIGKEVKFSEDGSALTTIVEVNNSSSEGFLSKITKLFQKR
jgi:translation elongation factor EF-1alpha